MTTVEATHNPEKKRRRIQGTAPARREIARSDQWLIETTQRGRERATLQAMENSARQNVTAVEKKENWGISLIPRREQSLEVGG